MSKWIEDAKARGIQRSQVTKQANEEMRHAQIAFSQEVVTEELVQKFLEPLTQEVEEVSAELREQHFKVRDGGYTYAYVAEPEKYALTRRKREPKGNKHNEAYGRTWVITAPTGQLLDVLHLTSLVSRATHFGRGYFTLESGGGAYTQGDECSYGIREMLKSRISSFYERGR